MSKTMRPEYQQILDALEAHKELTCVQISEITGISKHSVRAFLPRMKDYLEVREEYKGSGRGGYKLKYYSVHHYQVDPIVHLAVSGAWV